MHERPSQPLEHVQLPLAAAVPATHRSPAVAPGDVAVALPMSADVDPGSDAFAAELLAVAVGKLPAVPLLVTSEAATAGTVPLPVLFVPATAAASAAGPAIASADAGGAAAPLGSGTAMGGGRGAGEESGGGGGGADLQLPMRTRNAERQKAEDVAVAIAGRGRWWWGWGQAGWCDELCAGRGATCGCWGCTAADEMEDILRTVQYRAWALCAGSACEVSANEQAAGGVGAAPGQGA